VAKSKPQDFLNKYVSWDGKDFNEYIASDYGAFEDEEGRKLTGGDYYEARQAARPFLNPLRAVGMDEADMQYYAKKAGIRNVNSQSDLDQILAAWESDRFPAATDTATAPTGPLPQPDGLPQAPTEEMPGTAEEDTRRGMQNVLKYALDQFGVDSEYGQWARENYPFFAPYNRSSADPFAGVQYFGPNTPVRNVPEGLPSYMGESFTEEYEPNYVSSTEVAEAERPEGYMTPSEEERVGNVATLALGSLLRQYGLA